MHRIDLKDVKTFCPFHQLMTWTSHCLRPFQMLMFTVSLFNSDSNQECDQKSLEELLRLRTAALLLGPWFPGGGHDAPPPPSLLSWAWVASLATISWLSSTPIMLTVLSVSYSWLTFIAWPFGWPIDYLSLYFVIKFYSWRSSFMKT